MKFKVEFKEHKFHWIIGAQDKFDALRKIDLEEYNKGCFDKYFITEADPNSQLTKIQTYIGERRTN